MKIAILGNLVGVANEVVIGLRQSGIQADLFIFHSEKHNTFTDRTGQEELKPDWIYYIDSEPLPCDSLLGKLKHQLRNAFHKVLIVKQLLKYDIIHSYTGSLNFSVLSYLLFVLYKKKPYLAFATGSDIREVAQFETGWRGFLMRQFFKRASQAFLLNADMVAFKDNLGLNQGEFFPFIINEEKHDSLDVFREDAHKTKLLCFMMSNLDFGSTDSSRNRNSMKFNDKVFYALSEYIKNDTNIHLIALDRGPDREIAKQLVAKLKLEQFVTFHPPMSELERIRHLNMADVVLDQFNIGAFGLGSLEALSVGKPLVTYFNKDYLADSYVDELPILNAETVEEICESLQSLRDEQVRKKVSKNSRAWLIKHHSRGAVIDKLLSYYKNEIEL